MELKCIMIFISRINSQILTIRTSDFSDKVKRFSFCEYSIYLLNIAETKPRIHKWHG